MIKEKNYQRIHLRAPYFQEVLFEDDNFVFKAATLNISEGGMLFDQLPHFSDKIEVPLLICLPQFPFFKNFSLGRMKDFSQEIFPKKIIRLKGSTVRRESMTTEVEQVFQTRIGIRFTDCSPQAKKLISDYVSVFISNIVHLQALLDNVNSDNTALEKVRILSQILGYRGIDKISLLRKQVTHDYRSLQWL